MQELLKALVKAKAEFKPIPKDKQGPRNRYSSLDAVLGAVEPALHKNGLAIVQATKHDGERFYLETTLFHTSGESLISTYPLLDGAADSQKIGSSITYARRYSLCALLSVVADEDDDGAAASPSAGLSSVLNSRKASNPPAKPANPLEKHVAEIIRHGMENGLDVTDIKSLCRASNLPDTKGGYTNPAQVTILAQLIEDAISEAA
jgi:hypothetical protein